MAGDEVGDAIARHSISDEAGEDAAALFRNVDTSHKMPHAVHDQNERRDSDDFAFADSILRLNPTQENDESRDPTWTQHSGARADSRRISLLDAVSLTVGLQVVSMLFVRIVLIGFQGSGSIGCSILVWLISGALAMTGASSFAELATAIPLNGGAQAYLQYSMGPLLGFIYSWTTIVALKPSSGAIIASILGEYATRAILHILNGPSGGFHKYDRGDLPGFGIKTIGALSVLFICFVLSVHRSLGTRFQLGITVAKVALLYTIPVVAIIVMAQGHMPTESKHAFATFSGLFEGSTTSISRYALAIYSGLWAYDGWDQCTFVAGEIRNVSVNVPRSIRLSSVLVTVSFTVTVIAYFATLPPALVASTNSVALDFGSNALGLVGGVLFAAVVAISCLGALNGHLYTYSRLIFAAGQEGFLPSFFGTYNGYFRTPINATLLGTVLILCFVLFGSGFVSLVNFSGVCAWFWYGTTVLGLLVLRVKEPNLSRPYKTWLITPIMFVAIAMFLLIMPIFAAPLEAIAAFAFISAGVPVYFVTQRSGQRYLYRLFPSAWRPQEDAAESEEAFELTGDEARGPEQK